MTQPAKSQWDFGELFSPQETRRVLSVSELTTQVKRLLEAQVGSVWVSGEVTNLRAQSSGHIYFTLKDVGAQLSCVLFSREKVPHRDLLADGQKILLQGDVTVYEARGQYQLIVRALELQGVGALQVKFEKLKQQLAAEGLFALERKRELPKFPQRIGIVTSPAGAAIRDVLHVIARRHPGLEIILAPCRVQGEGAAQEIAQAIRALNELNLQPSTFNLNLILVTRGGGSLEDLWAFNEEPVARAIFESEIPVVSAVGHEIDFTIADFVADFRAATPSAAAEIITEGVFASREFVAQAPALLRRAMRRSYDTATDDFLELNARLTRQHPRRRLDDSLQRLDDLQTNLIRSVKSAARERSLACENLAARLSRVRPASALARQREALRQLEARLHSLGPEQVLARGYSITTDSATGKVLRRAQDAKAGQKLRTRLADGEVSSLVEK
jgi:exodeoxyribonuclease VII large subunit